MRIEINNTTVAIAVILLLGYIAMFISIISTSSQTNSIVNYSMESQNSNLLRVNFDKNLNDAKKVITSNYADIDRLKLQIQQLSSDKLQHKSSTLIKLQHDNLGNSNEHQHVDRPGVIILGMHRSGTSVLGGLMNKMGLKTGGPLIQPAEDNAKGFFERIDVVLQNDAIMRKQGIDYSSGTYKYDHIKGLKDILESTTTTDITGGGDKTISVSKSSNKFFNEGKRGLHFLNDKSNYPWMLKDPRLCITVRTWLPLLNFVPAIVFTYRHPLDVALSMHKREGFRVAHGLKLWYIYNQRAIQQTNDLCRVATSHNKVMKQPQVELDRIFNELHNCGVNVPRKVEHNDLTEFVDIKLQHGRTSLQDSSCMNIDNMKDINPPSTWATDSTQDIKLYRECIRVYCALEDYSAYEKNFLWDSSVFI